MPNTSHAALPYPAPGTPPATRSWLQRLAVGVDGWLLALDNRLNAERAADRKEALDAARASSLVRGDIITGNAGTMVVATGRQGVPGCAFNVPPGVALIVRGSFDVACLTFNGGSVFEGRLSVINRTDNSAELIPRSAVWNPGTNNSRGVATQTWKLGAANYTRTVQANVLKSSTSADYQVNGANTCLEWLLLQNGTS